MKTRKFWLVLGLGVCAVTTARAGLLDDVIRKPGMWNQMCSMPQPLAFDVPLPMYALATPRNFYLSQENLAQLRAQRAAVAADIVGHLDRMDLSKAANGDERVSVSQGTNAGTNQPIVVRASRPFSFSDSHQDPAQLSGTLLDIILQLDVVEALPGLLRVEADLNQRLAAAAKDGGASLPALDLGSPLMCSDFNGADFTSESRSRKMREFAARVYQREMLSVMAALLRHERYQPLLDSDLEAKYFAHLKEGADDRQLSGIRSAADIPKGQEGWIGFDPVHGRAFRKNQLPSGFVRFTPELRLEIRQWATDYLRQTAGEGKAAATTAGK